MHAKDALNLYTVQMTVNLNSVKILFMSRKPPQRYHHGDLREALLREALLMIRESGLDSLSLRQLAQRAGVSASALYHHFENKNDLLCALAELGFVTLDKAVQEAAGDTRGCVRDRTLRFVRAYVSYAADNPEIYELMFGRTIWKSGKPTESLRTLAYDTFRRYVEFASGFDARVGRGRKGLRRAQARWATVHGLCRLIIDGIYAGDADIEGMTAAAADLLVSERT